MTADPPSRIPKLLKYAVGAILGAILLLLLSGGPVLYCAIYNEFRKQRYSFLPGDDDTFTPVERCLTYCSDHSDNPYCQYLLWWAGKAFDAGERDYP